MSHLYIERPNCQGCGKPIAYGQKFLHTACNRTNEQSIEGTCLQVINLYKVYAEDPDLTHVPVELLGVYTSFGAADAAATGKGISGLKAFIRTVKGIVYNGKAYILKHTIISQVDVCFADIDKHKREEALSKLSPEERTLLGLDLDKS